MTMISGKIALCSKCGEETPVEIILSMNSYGAKHSDLFQECSGSEVLHHQLSICSKCLFVGYSDEFTNIKEKPSINRNLTLDEEIKELNKKYPATQRFIMLAERHEKEGGHKDEIANYYLRASWSERAYYSDSKDFFEQHSKDKQTERKKSSFELEKYCQKKAVEYFLLSLEDNGGKVSSDKYYLIGELFRRIASFDKSIEYFEKAITAFKKEQSSKEYYGVSITDLGSEKEEALISKIRKATNMIPTPEWRANIYDAVKKKPPIKLLMYANKYHAFKSISHFKDIGIKATYQKDPDIPLDKKKFLNLIEDMKRLAEQNDASPKVLDWKDGW
jgi:tetratricopeptide (TPR) repeat protein